MKTPEISTIEVDDVSLDENGKVPFLALHIPAADADVECVISATTEGYDGRSDWRWFRLPNGDLILGVFPQGDTYMQFSDSINI